MGFSVHKNLYSNLMLWRSAVMNQDIDCVVLVDGAEGSGKSVHGLQVAHILDKDNKIDIDTQVCYTPDKLKEAITTLEPFKAVVFDEGGRGFNRRSSTDKTNIDLVNLFRECRQNNLFLIVIMPTFYDMDMNMAVWRSRILLHVSYEWDLSDRKKPLVRGFARFYNEKGKKKLYTNKRWRMEYAYPFLNNMAFDYKFPHHYVVDEQKYRDNKRSSEEDYRTKDKKDPSKCPECQGSIHYNTSKGYKCHKGHVWKAHTHTRGQLPIKTRSDKR